MTKTFVHTFRSLVAITVASSALLVGCQETNYPDPQPSTSGFLNTARVLFVNASNAAGLSALIENTPAGATISPGQSTSYVSAPVSSDQIRIKGAGGTFGSNDLASKATFLPNTSYTVFVTDTITRPKTTNTLTGATTDAGGIRLLTVTDTLTAPATGTAKVRVFNLAPDVSTASVRLLNPATSQGAAVFPGRAYRNVAAANLRYSSVPAGTYTTQVYSATAVPSSTTAPTAASSNVTLADGKIYTLYVSGLNRTKTLGVGTV